MTINDKIKHLRFNVSVEGCPCELCGPYIESRYTENVAYLILQNALYALGHDPYDYDILDKFTNKVGDFVADFSLDDADLFDKNGWGGASIKYEDFIDVYKGFSGEEN